jgi:hypothetical protein
MDNDDVRFKLSNVTGVGTHMVDWRLRLKRQTGTESASIFGQTSFGTYTVWAGLSREPAEYIELQR